MITIENAYKLDDHHIENMALKVATKRESEELDGDKEDADTSETFMCESHGSQRVKVGYVGRQAMLRLAGRCGPRTCTKSYVCEACQIEERDRLEIMRKESIAARKKKELDQAKICRGVSPRNLDVTFSDFDVSNPKQESALKLFKDMADRVKAGEKRIPNLIVTGSVGTGKSMLASAMVNEVWGSASAAITTVARMMRVIKGTWRRDSEETEQQAIDRFIEQDLLIIDEVGVQFDSETEKMLIFDLIDGRYQHMRPTVLISNLDVNGVKSILGARCFDRLRDDGGKLIALDFESQRGKGR